ncbi:hypothetical protein MJT46_019193 [Ovis ammon polii x Ovis aries]|nr:hypothetical protein MJT46_019193 [Ovis ammon polii x Ovis aries]
MECRALAWSWCQSASAQLSVSPVALQAVEAAAAELALESPLGHLDHVIQPHGQCLLVAGARASPVHAEEVQGRGAGGLKPAQAPVQVLLDLCLKEDTLKQTLSYLLKKAKRRSLLHLSCQKLSISTMPTRSIRRILKVVQLDCVEDLEVNCTWNRATLGRFVLHLGQMGNLPRLPLWRIHVLPHTAPKRRSTASPSSRPSS